MGAGASYSPFTKMVNILLFIANIPEFKIPKFLDKWILQSRVLMHVEHNTLTAPGELLLWLCL